MSRTSSLSLSIDEVYGEEELLAAWSHSHWSSVTVTLDSVKVTKTACLCCLLPFCCPKAEAQGPCWSPENEGRAKRSPPTTRAVTSALHTHPQIPRPPDMLIQQKQPRPRAMALSRRSLSSQEFLREKAWLYQRLKSVLASPLALHGGAHLAGTSQPLLKLLPHCRNWGQG